MAPPSRRSTLGPVNMNRRQSIGGPSAETPGKANNNARRPPKGRKSMLPRVGRESLVPPSPSAALSTASSRRRSVGGENRRKSMDRRQSLVPPPSHTSVVKTDPRPITDKAYQGQCIKQLLQYLTKNGYAYPISPKSLARPSGKDFGNIVTFMLRKLDPSFQDGHMKFEDEVAMNFKAMGYPYPISKTALVAAGSPHTWPALLAALTWLMEHLQCQEADELQQETTEEKSFETMEELERKTDKAFFKFLSDNYSAFLEGNQALTEDLEEAFVDSFERDNMVIEQEIERVNELNGLIVEKMNHLGHQSQSYVLNINKPVTHEYIHCPFLTPAFPYYLYLFRLPELFKKREDYATDLEQFQDLVRQMDEHKEALEQKVKERTAELKATNEQVDHMTSKIQVLKERVQGQELSVDDVRKMESEQLRVKEMLQRVSTQRQQCKKELWEAEAELSKLLEELDGVVDDYNTKLSELLLVLDDPSGATKFKLSVKKQHLESGDQSRLLGVDLYAEVRPYLSRTKSEMTSQMSRFRHELQESLDALDASEEAFTEALDKLKVSSAVFMLSYCSRSLFSRVLVQSHL